MCKIKPFLLVALIIALILGVCGCSNASEEESENVINFYCYSLNKMDKQVFDIASREFSRLYPGYSVKLTEFEKNRYTVDKYITTVNTKLMSGEGYDIIKINYLPIHKYYEKGIFADLDELIINDGEFNEDLYFKNVIDACRYEGKLYSLPLHFNIRTIVASKKVLEEENILIDDKSWSLRDLLEYSKRLTKDIDGDGIIDRYAFPKFDIGTATGLFLETEKFIDYEEKKSHFDSESFIELVECLKEFSESGLMHKEIILGGEREYKDQGATVFSGNEIYGFKGLLYTKYQMGGGDKLFFRMPSSTKEGDSTAISRIMLAVNNKSAKKKYAAEFLKILLSGEVQKHYGYALDVQGFPIMKEEFDNQLKNVRSLDWRLQSSGGWVPVILDDDDVQFVYDYVSDIDTMTYVDSKIMEIVALEVNKLIGSGFSLEKKNISNVARDIQNKVKIYLEE